MEILDFHAVAPTGALKPDLWPGGQGLYQPTLACPVYLSLIQAPFGIKGIGPREQLTWDQDPARHRPGQSSRLQARRLSGRWSLQCLVCTERVVLLCRG